MSNLNYFSFTFCQSGKKILIFLVTVINNNSNILCHFNKEKKYCFRWADQCGPFRDSNHQFPDFSNVALNFGHVWSASVVDDKGLEGLIMDWYNEVDIDIKLIYKRKKLRSL